MVKVEPHPIWQWAETNQGLLSLAALVLALLFALLEMRRANSETARRIKEYVSVVLELADNYAADLNGAIVGWGTNRFAAITAWEADRQLKRKALDLLRQSCPADGRLVLLLVELDEAFARPFPRQPAVPNDPLPTLNARAVSLAEVRRRIADRG